MSQKQAERWGADHLAASAPDRWFATALSVDRGAVNPQVVNRLVPNQARIDLRSAAHRGDSDSQSVALSSCVGWGQ